MTRESRHGTPAMWLTLWIDVQYVTIHDRQYQNNAVSSFTSRSGKKPLCCTAVRVSWSGFKLVLTQSRWVFLAVLRHGAQKFSMSLKQRIPKSKMSNFQGRSWKNKSLLNIVWQLYHTEFPQNVHSYCCSSMNLSLIKKWKMIDYWLLYSNCILIHGKYYGNLLVTLVYDVSWDTKPDKLNHKSITYYHKLLSERRLQLDSRQNVPRCSSSHSDFLIFP